MTDGDITRLNRMYKCPKFEDEKIEMFKESDSLNSAPSTETLNQDSFNMNKQQDELTKEVQKESEGEASQEDLIMSLKNMSNGLSKLIKPLCDYQKQLQNIFRRI